MSYAKIMRADSLPHYIISCLAENANPFPNCDFAVIKSKIEEIDEVKEVERKVDSWFELKPINGPPSEEKFFEFMRRITEAFGINLHYDDLLIVRFRGEFVQYHFNRMFIDFLDLTEFDLIKDENGYGVKDLQGGNLGNIEEDRFTNATEVIDRMDRYIFDYLVNPILMDVFNGEEQDCDFGELAQRAITLVKHTCGDDYDILDVLCNHGEEIDLVEIYKRYGEKQR